MIHKITVPVEITIEGNDGRMTMPSFYSGAATISGGDTDIGEIGVCAYNPFAFYLFAKHGSPLKSQNHGFVAIVNIHEAIQSVIAQFPDANAKDKAEITALEEFVPNLTQIEP